MLGTNDALGVLVRGRGKRRTTAIAIAVTLSLGGLATRAQAPAVSPTGSVGGLEAKFIDVQGVRTRYYEMGQGETILLVHGGESWSAHSSANTWVRNISGLSKRFHVLAPDRLGTGMTGAPVTDKDFNTQGELAHLFQFLRAKNVTKVHIVGQSMGGMAAFYFAVAHPDIVKTLVIVNSASLVPVDVGETNRPSMLAAQCPDARTDDFGEWRCRLRLLSSNPDRAFDEFYFETGRFMMNQSKAKEILAKVAAGAGEPLRSQAGEFKRKNLQQVTDKGFGSMPVLLYWDKDDPSAILKGSTKVVDMKGALALYDLIAAKTPNVRLLISQGGGHFPYRLHREEFNQNLMNFIDFWNGPPTGEKTSRE
ncbi:MAG: hypothetical protein A2W26_03275 [Acidobacteria bacterium RBG_16_64_8]|nr:MAG: hypothetical protein A2W26_03275 [Acidobacteria bacterium RBG_16_64_8]